MKKQKRHANLAAVATGCAASVAASPLKSLTYAHPEAKLADPRKKVKQDVVVASPLPRGDVHAAVAKA